MGSHGRSLRRDLACSHELWTVHWMGSLGPVGQGACTVSEEGEWCPGPGEESVDRELGGGETLQGGLGDP